MAPGDNREMRERAEQWRAETLQAQLEAMGERKAEFETDSGIPVKTLYTPLDAAGRDYLASLGFPGEYPFTRGADPNMYGSRIYGAARFTRANISPSGGGRPVRGPQPPDITSH